MRQHTISTVLGGRCFDSNEFVLRRMNSLTIVLSSSDLSLLLSICFSVASGSLPASTGISKCLRKCAGVPSTPGFVKLTMA